MPIFRRKNCTHTASGIVALCKRLYSTPVESGLQSYTQHDLVRKPSTLDALIGYFTPSHVIHQRLLPEFLSAPEDGRKRVRNIAVTNKHTAKLNHVGSLYILTYDARKLKHKIKINSSDNA